MTITDQEKEDDVLRRMLNTPRRDHKALKEERREREERTSK
jgi:hypothetical protein